MQKSKLLDQSSTYLRQEKFDEAYGLLKYQYEQGSKLNFVSVLVKYYVVLFHVDQAERTDQVREELIEIFQEKFGDSCEEVLKYAVHLVEKKKYFEAVLFFQIFLTFFSKDKKVNPLKSIGYLEKCGKNLEECVRQLIENSVPRKIIRNHVLPWMKKLPDLALRFSRYGKTTSALIQAHHLGKTGNMQLLSFDFEGCEESNKAAVKIMEKNMKTPAKSHSLYGECLGNIGMSYYLRKRPVDAKQMFAKALVAVKEAEDFSTMMEKISTIKKYKDLLDEK